MLCSKPLTCPVGQLQRPQTVRHLSTYIYAAKKHKPQTSKRRKKRQQGEGRSGPRGQVLQDISEGGLLGSLGGFRDIFEQVKTRLTDKRVPLFHEEFEAAVQALQLGLSAQEAAAVQHRVDEAWSTAHLMPMHKAALKSENFDISVGSENLAKRLGPQMYTEEGMQWLLSAEPGSILLKKETITYDIAGTNFQSFSNTPCECVHMLPGSTHVAVGFADLGELATAVNRWSRVAPDQQLAASPDEVDDSTTAQLPHQQLEFENAEYVLQLLQQAAELSSGGSSTGTAQQPLMWVGYDASLYAVAKAAVLLEMMKQGAEPDAVLQVWFSSCWSHSTQAAFMQALAAVLGSNATSARDSSTSSLISRMGSWFTKQPVSNHSDDSSAQPAASSGGLLHAAESHQEDSNVDSSCSGAASGSSSNTPSKLLPEPLSPEVLRLLRHWQRQPDVSVAKSRSSWLERFGGTGAYIGGFERSQDRLALSRYTFTGELLAGDVGSTVMCSLPWLSGSRLTPDENILTTIELPTLLKEWNPEGQPQQRVDVVTAAVVIWRRRIGRLTQLLMEGHIIADVRHETLQLSNRSTVEVIHSLQPTSISWSNVPDYMVLKEFHQLAQQCSAAATVHFMHSMNWVREVKAACHIDMLLARHEALQRGHAGKKLADAVDLLSRKGHCRAEHQDIAVHT